MTSPNISTKYPVTWCPGCGNFMILEAAKRALSKFNKDDLAMVTGIGCHAKIYDYLNISGVYGLHGRVIPVMMGMKLGNPNLKVIGFAGDGDTYSEGMEHFIHAFRFNADMTLIVHNNQSFSLTTGQATPTTQVGYKNKAEPLGEFNEPLNPIKLALASGATFVARCSSSDLAHMSEVLEKAINHKGFSFVEILEKCAIFNRNMNSIDKLVYKIKDNSEIKKAMELADEWNYNSASGKIPVGVIYQTRKNTLEEKWPQLRKKLKK
jgi:2-oxoglutarate ferredoxin oxidoreductase subunit beta